MRHVYRARVTAVDVIGGMRVEKDVDVATVTPRLECLALIVAKSAAQIRRSVDSRFIDCTFAVA